jgi:hypothetical protein
MTSTLIALIVLLVIVLLWMDGARAREFATALVNELCRRRGVQLLDGTVSVARVGIRRSPQGLRFRRMFRFDFSAEGVGRRTGYLLLLGTDVEKVIFDLPEEPGAPPEATHEPTDTTPGTGNRDNVVPLRRPPKD